MRRSNGRARAAEAMAALVAVATLATASTAEAAAPRRYALTVAADDPSCPSAEGIALAIQRHAAHELTGAPGDPVFAVTFTRRDTDFEAAVRGEGGAERILTGAACADLLGAVAAVIALTLDPVPAAEPVPAADDEAPAAPAPPPQRRRRRPVTAAPRPATPAATPMGAAVALRAVSMHAFAPELSFGGSADMELLPVPWVGLFGGVLGLAPRETALGPGALETSFVGGRLGACAYLLRSAVILGPCLDVVGGVRFAEGRGVRDPKSERLATIAPGAGMRLLVPLGAAFSLDVQAGLAVPLPRDRFVVAGSPAVEGAGIVSQSIQLGLRYELR